jgi:uncharacterized membrane protein
LYNLDYTTQNLSGTTDNRSWTRYICHQRPERCFTIQGIPMPICSRCFGFYLGLLIGLLIPIFVWSLFVIDVNTMFLLLILSLIPISIDGLTQLLGLRISNNNLRFITGFIAGLFLGLVFTWLIIRILIL